MAALILQQLRDCHGAITILQASATPENRKLICQRLGEIKAEQARLFSQLELLAA